MLVSLISSLPLVDAALNWDPFPADGYAPYRVTCPADANFLRTGDGISASESEWLEGRDLVTQQAMIDWLSNSNLAGFNASEFLSSSTIRAGIAFSGGGYGAMVNGAGQFAAFDARTNGSTQPGHMGGLVQASTYITGLNGGNWLLSSLVVNNWTTVDQLLSSNYVWQLDRTLSDPWDSMYTTKYWLDLVRSVDAKRLAFYDVSWSDWWGRELSYQLFDFANGAPSLNYHYIRNYDAFKSYEMPFPIHVADGRAPGTSITSTNSTCFEFNPFELGSWDPNVNAFTDIQYLGTDVLNGKPTGWCYNGFDNAGYMTWTSSSALNRGVAYLKQYHPVVYRYAKVFFNSWAGENDDAAPYDPNPFLGMESVDSSISRATSLNLVDGGEDGQNIPLQPLLQQGRHVDIVFAMDNSADTGATDVQGANWANGTSLVATYARQFSTQGNGTSFPYVPDAEGFVYGGLTEQPVFFGCSNTNLTGLIESNGSGYTPPIIVYIANSRHSYDANFTTLADSVQDNDLKGMLNNGYNLVTQNNGTIDSEWRTCVACAIILREQQRRNETPSEQCQQCFSNYCWDGTVKNSSNGNSGRRDGRSNIPGANGSTSSTTATTGASTATSAIDSPDTTIYDCSDLFDSTTSMASHSTTPTGVSLATDNTNGSSSVSGSASTSTATATSTSGSGSIIGTGSASSSASTTFNSNGSEASSTTASGSSFSSTTGNTSGSGANTSSATGSGPSSSSTRLDSSETQASSVTDWSCSHSLTGSSGSTVASNSGSKNSNTGSPGSTTASGSLTSVKTTTITTGTIRSTTTGVSSTAGVSRSGSTTHASSSSGTSKSVTTGSSGTGTVGTTVGTSKPSSTTSKSRNAAATIHHGDTFAVILPILLGIF